MTKNIIIAVLAVLLVITSFFALNYYLYYEKQGGMESAMHGMTSDLEGKTGAEFDRAFLDGMIVHHEGAVEMAELALMHSAQPELKAMANAIIEAQTEEIAQMKAWRDAWFPGEEHVH